LNIFAVRANSKFWFVRASVSKNHCQTAIQNEPYASFQSSYKQNFFYTS